MYLHLRLINVNNEYYHNSSDTICHQVHLTLINVINKCHHSSSDTD